MLVIDWVVVLYPFAWTMELVLGSALLNVLNLASTVQRDSALTGSVLCFAMELGLYKSSLFCGNIYFPAKFQAIPGNSRHLTRSYGMVFAAVNMWWCSFFCGNVVGMRGTDWWLIGVFCCYLSFWREKLQRYHLVLPCKCRRS